MGRALEGPRVDCVEQKYGKPIREILAPYLKYRTPAPQIARMLDVPLPTIRFWLKQIRKK